MKNLLVIGGTADSNNFLKQLPDDCTALVSVCSELGAKATISGERIFTVYGPLDTSGFETLIRKHNISHVVDCSHPFAAEVTQNAKSAANQQQIPFIRFERESFTGTKGVFRFPTVSAAAAYAAKLSGNVFLTIGSHQLQPFLDDPQLKDRCYMRVLADHNVLASLERNGVDSSRIFAMKGVASTALNIALAQEIHAGCIVTKDSGKTGGLNEKYAAAKALNIPLLVIDRPRKEENVFHTIEAVIREIRRS